MESNAHFFNKPVFLTASAQLHLEALTNNLGKVYTLSPTFRAEKSLTRHHLAEFYMLEAELIDMNDLGQLLDFVELLVKNVSSRVHERFNKNDLQLMVSENKKGLCDIEAIVQKKFIRLTYTEAIRLLNDLFAKNTNLNILKRTIEFGEDLNKEQEKLIVEHFKVN